MSVKLLLEAISKRTDINDLIYLRDTGLDKLILDPLSNILESERTLIVEAINAKIAELSK